jgi:hypothetical protein
MRSLGWWLASVLLSAQSLPERLAPILGVPYVVDAGEDEQGRCVLFTHPDQPLPSKGYNCSGFVVAAARRLLGFQGSLTEASQDRLGDSGPKAPLGQDWDFGWDLVLNLSEGHERHWLAPEGPHPVEGDGRSSRGFRVHDEAAWSALRPQLRADRVYLAVFNRVQKGRLKHHHVGVILKDGAGQLWFYQTLPKGRSHRLSLDSPQGMARLKVMFGPGESLRLLAVDPAPGSRR